MKMIQCTCPACGADLKIKERRETIYCEYCGAAIAMDDIVIDKRKNVTVNNHINLSKNVSSEEAEASNERKKLLITTAGKGIKWAVLCFFLYVISPKGVNEVFATGGYAILGLCALGFALGALT